MRKEEFDSVRAHFYCRIGLIRDLYLLQDLGILSDNAIGGFWPSKLPKLVEFCQENPAYHIVSWKDFNLYNRVSKEADGFYLADGDREPEMESIMPPEIITIVESFIYQVLQNY